MLRRNAYRPKPRQSQTARFVAPVGGWISNRSLSLPADGPAGAAILDNFIPRATGVLLRRGTIRYATLGDGSLDTRSLFQYNVGNERKLFGATDDGIYDITSTAFAYNAQIVDDEGDRIINEDGDWFGWSSAGPAVYEGFTDGDWVVVQFATAGGVFLIGVNGTDAGFIYDGTDFWPNEPGGLWRLPYDTETTPFTVGSAVTGGTSGATGVIYRDDGDALIISAYDFPPEVWEIDYKTGSKAFTEGSTLRGETSNASAKITGITPGVTTWTLGYDGGTGAFAPAEIVTGATSGATGTVVSVAGATASGTLTIFGLTGTFLDNEVLDGNGAGLAVVNGQASAPILAGTLELGTLSGNFIAGETLKDGSGGSAIAVGAQAFISGGGFEDNEAITDDDGGDALVDGDIESAVPGVTFPDGLTTADMSYVWVYKNRLWFAQENTLDAWYMDEVASIGGTATRFPLAGVMARGGSLLFGQGWSLEGGAEGGLSEQNVFVSTEGEVAIYQGDFPGEAATWSKVGVYRIGKPLGKRAFFRGGGDLAICTSVGLVPLSRAIQLDITSLNTATISYGIQDAWLGATQTRVGPWQAELWPEEKIAVIAPPVTEDAPLPVLFVSNSETGAWGRITGWHVTAMEVFEGALFYGGPEGRVMIANVGGQDEGAAYTGVCLPLYDEMQSPSSLKVPTVGRAVVRASTAVVGQISFQADYNLAMPSPPNASAIQTVANLWGSGIWGLSVWGGGIGDYVSMPWASLGGSGYAISAVYQVTSGEVQPLDVELARIELLYTVAEPVS